MTEACFSCLFMLLDIHTVDFVTSNKNTLHINKCDIKQCCRALTASWLKHAACLCYYFVISNKTYLYFSLSLHINYIKQWCSCWALTARSELWPIRAVLYATALIKIIYVWSTMACLPNHGVLAETGLESFKTFSHKMQKNGYKHKLAQACQDNGGLG